MTAVLGPPGVFPPDPVGARVWCSGGPWLVRHVSGADEVWLVGESRRALVRRAECRLDLSDPHSLDAATRALWALLGGEQPLTAPGWIGGRACWWLLNGQRRCWCACGGKTLRMGDGGTPTIPGLTTDDPRQALALVLAAVAEARR